MVRKSVGLLTALLMLLAPWGGPVRAAEPSFSGDDWILLRMAIFVHASQTVTQMRQSLMRLFLETDVDGGGISQSDTELLLQLRQARTRAQNVVQWAQADLDADGKVTRAELLVYHGKQARQPLRSSGVELLPTKEQVQQALDMLAEKSLRADSDGDGTITFAEALKAADTEARKLLARLRRPQNHVPMTLDRDGDGAVSRQEFETTVDRLLRTFDSDGNGEFSEPEAVALKALRQELQKKEREAIQSAQREAKERVLIEACGLPKPSAKAKVLLVETRHGLALSEVAFKTDNGIVSVADVHVEQGASPIYVIVSSVNPTIWRFSGSVERVETVVASATKAHHPTVRQRHALKPRAGVVGIKADAVYVPPRPDCFDGHMSYRSQRRAQAKVPLERLLGRPADQQFKNKTISTVSLPSGIFDRSPVYRDTMKIPTSGRGAAMWREVKRHYPGGIAKIDPPSVVSRAALTSSGELPREAGLARLLDAGAIEMIGTSQVVRVNGLEITSGGGRDNVVVPKGKKVEVVERPNEFLVLKKIRFPRGLTSIYPLRFQLAPGVPKPEGDPGRSCVIDQTSGKPIIGAVHCRR